MKFLINKMFNILEDPSQPFLGRNDKLLKLFGIILPENNNKLKFLYFICHGWVVLLITSQWMELYSSRSDLILILRNVKYAIFASVNVMKVSTFILWQKDWRFIVNFTTKVDEERRKIKDKITQDILQRYTHQTKIVTYLYFYLTFGTLAILITQPIAQFVLSSSYREKLRNGEEKPLEVVNSWLPVDKTTTRGYATMIICQMLPILYQGGWIASYDSIAIAIMTFVSCELELLRRDCQILFGDIEEPVSQEEAKARLAKFHKRHRDLIIIYIWRVFSRCSELFDSCLSSIMLVYVVICSCMLCATAYQFTQYRSIITRITIFSVLKQWYYLTVFHEIESDPLMKLSTAEYLVFALAQLFLYCWHSNEAFYISKDLMLGPYESIWYTRSLSEQKEIHILTHQVDKIIVFTAGPFSSITVTSFINILKGTYSYYTLLSQSQEN